MKVSVARDLAREWVRENEAQIVGFLGAYFSGSTVGMAGEDELPPSSDVDIVIVVDAEEPPLKPGKFLYKGVLLEVTYLSYNQLDSVEEVLTSYHLAGSFRKNTIIADPTGWLRELQSRVSKHFPEEKWVGIRCHNVIDKIETGIMGIDVSKPFYDLVNSWLFPTAITTHGILVAALKNPTVRLRYPRTREVLMEYGYGDFYIELLKLLGCAHMSPEIIGKHLDNLERAFDAASYYAETPFFFSSDITQAAKSIAIDGSRELIRTGDHREAVFWIGATFARCHKILEVDGPPGLQSSLMPDFEGFVRDLGITSTQDFISRGQDTLNFLPRLQEVMEDIILRNKEIIR